MISDKKIIINADDYGLSNSFNNGIEKAYLEGFLTSTSIRTNGKNYSKKRMDALKDRCPDLGLGLHFNIVEGKTDLEIKDQKFNMYTEEGFYNLSYISIILNSFRKDFCKQVELELREQIERIIMDLGYVDHINSHQHCNTPPIIFDLTCRIAKEYGIKYIRVPNERIVFSENKGKLFTKRFLVNIFKCLILKFFSVFNYFSAKKYGIKTNDCFSGVLFTGFMDSSIIRRSIQSIKPGETLEILLHPCDITGDEEEIFWPNVRDYVISHNRRRELEVLTNQRLLREILDQEVLLTQYDLLDQRNTSLNKSKRIQNVLGRIADKKESLRVFLVMDETTFFHPEYINSVITEIEGIDCVGACLVVLPKGGALQSYLISQWKRLGLRDLFLLTITTILIRLRGLLPKSMKYNFYPSVSSVMKENQIPFLKISSISQDVIDYIESFNPDIVLSSNSLIFPEDLIKNQNITFINRHSSLLPSYGGILPVFRAIQYGEEFCGASVHLMDKKIDEGRVISRKWLPIEKGDSIFKLYKLLFVLSFLATKESIEKVRDQKPTIEFEDDHRINRSYFSYPKEDDWIAFKKNKGRFI